MIKKRKQYSPEFKAKVALAAIRMRAGPGKVGDPNYGVPFIIQK